MKHIYVQRQKTRLTHQECSTIQIALLMMLRDINTTNETPWAPAARRQIMVLKKSASSAASKMEKVTGMSMDLPDADPGDEKYYFTKES